MTLCPRAFNQQVNAAQRCVCCLCKMKSDEVIGMIKGAMKELHVGDPAYLATDVGPVIDQKALDALNEHVAYLKDKTTLL